MRHFVCLRSESLRALLDRKVTELELMAALGSFRELGTGDPLSESARSGLKIYAAGLEI